MYTVLFGSLFTRYDVFELHLLSAWSCAFPASFSQYSVSVCKCHHLLLTPLLTGTEAVSGLQLLFNPARNTLKYVSWCP